MDTRNALHAGDRQVGVSDVRRARPGHRLMRGLIALGMAVAASVHGTEATALPVLSFTSGTFTADGINSTLVTVLVEVENPDPAFGVTALDSQIQWTASGGASLTDLVSLGTGSANSTGYLFATVIDSFTFQSGSTQPLNWGVATLAPATMAGSGSVTPVATLNFRIPAGVTSGIFNVSFLTGNQFNTFTDAAFEPVPYANGNNGTTKGVITIVPEPTAGAYVATVALFTAGMVLAQRKGRRGRRTAEIVG